MLESSISPIPEGWIVLQAAFFQDRLAGLCPKMPGDDWAFHLEKKANQGFS